MTIVYNPHIRDRIDRIEEPPTMKRFALVTSLAALLGLSAVLGSTHTLAQDPTEKKSEGKDEKPTRVEKSDAEWQKLLTRDQYLVTRKKFTEPAGTGKYAHFKGKGIFACVCCGTELFDARTKFESGTGWPSFYRPINQTRIATADDFTEAEPRVEVTCAVCDAHLGHVFNDGPRPTGLRFCINSASLKLVKPPAPTTKTKEKAATKTDGAKSKTTTPKAKAKATEKDPNDPGPSSPE